MDAYTTDLPIYALATPYSHSAIAVIRTSGDGVISLLSKAFSNKEKLLKAKTNTLVYGKLYDKENKVVDEVVLAIYKKGHGYTGEEAVEINAHGSLCGLDRIFKLLEEIGFKKAKKGEFTYRAFMHGRIDLTQAEAVEEIILSKSEKTHENALSRLGGSLKELLLGIKEELVYILASLEVQLDYAEDEILEEWVMPRERIESICKRVRNLIYSYSANALYREGAKIVLAGKTNVGKSSLFNLIAKEERAIVSPLAGTTRDYIELLTTINGIPIRLFDTAGLRDSDDIIESEGIKRSEKLIGEADLVLYLTDSDDDVDIECKNLLVVRTKNDIYSLPGLSISTKTGDGIKELFDKVTKILLKDSSTQDGSVSIDSERVKKSLEDLLEQLEFILKCENESVDILALFFQAALSILSEITGETTNEEILDVLFSKFCLGK